MAAPPPPPFEPAGLPFEDWVDARASALGRFAYVLTGSLDDADTVVQDALVSARLGWRRLGADPDVEDRLQAMVVRAYLRHGRHGKGGRAVEQGEPVYEGWLPAPGSSHEPDEEAALVWQRCAALPPRRRAALVLRCLEGYPVTEISAVLGGRRHAAAGDLDAALAAVLPVLSGLPEAADERRRIERIGHGLRQYADTAPPVLAAAERATAQARGRHRRRIAAMSVAAALVLPAIAWAVSSGPGVQTQTPAAQSLAPERPHVGGWRWESWGGVEVQVPRSWGQGDLTQWCADHGTSGPAVDRPGRRRAGHELCSLYDNGRPTYTAGLLMRWAATSPRLSRADVAPYATTRIFTLGGVTLTLVDVDPAVGDAILSSAQVIGGRDHHGCEPQQQLGGAGFLADGPTAALRSGIGPAEAVSVCRYGLRGGWSGTRLISSRLLTGPGARHLVTALRTAPATSTPGVSRRCHVPEREFAVLDLWPDGYPAASVGAPASLLVRYDGCSGHGLYDGRSVRRLTPQVLRPITVPPWSGAIAPDLRHLVRAQIARMPRLTRSH